MVMWKRTVSDGIAGGAQSCGLQQPESLGALAEQGRVRSPSRQGPTARAAAKAADELLLRFLEKVEYMILSSCARLSESQASIWAKM